MKTVKKKEYDLFLDEMIPNCAEQLRQLAVHIERGVRYVLVPINDGDFFHWHMVVLDLEKKVIHARDSMWGYRSTVARSRVVS